MDELLALCSTSLVARLGGAGADGNPLRVRLRAARALERHVRGLERRHAQVISWRFGIDEPPMTYAQIAARLGVSPGHAEQLVTHALEELGWALISAGDEPVEEVAA